MREGVKWHMKLLFWVISRSILPLTLYIACFGLEPWIIKSLKNTAVGCLVAFAFVYLLPFPRIFGKAFSRLAKDLKSQVYRVGRGLQKSFNDVADEVYERSNSKLKQPELYKPVMGSWISMPSYQILTQGAYFVRHYEKRTERVFIMLFPEEGDGTDHPVSPQTGEIGERIVVRTGLQRDRVVEKRFGGPTGIAGFFARSKIKLTTYRAHEILAITTGASSKPFVKARSDQGFLSSIFRRKSPRSLDPRACFSLLFLSGSIDLEAIDPQEAVNWVSAFTELLSATDSSLRRSVGRIPNLMPISETNQNIGNNKDSLSAFSNENSIPPFHVMPPIAQNGKSSPISANKHRKTVDMKDKGVGSHDSSASSQLWQNFSHIIKLRSVRPLYGWRFTIILPYSLYETLLKPGFDVMFLSRTLAGDDFSSSGFPRSMTSLSRSNLRLGTFTGFPQLKRHLHTSRLKFSWGDVAPADFFRLASSKSADKPLIRLSATRRVADALTSIRAKVGNLNSKTLAMLTYLDRNAVYETFSTSSNGRTRFHLGVLLHSAAELVRLVPLVEPFQSGTVMRRVAAAALASHGSRAIIPVIWSFMLRKEAEILAGFGDDPSDILSYSSVAEDGVTVRYLLFDPTETADQMPHGEDVLRAFRYASRSLPGYVTSVLPHAISVSRLVCAAVREVLYHRLPKLARSVTFYNATVGLDLDAHLVQRGEELRCALHQRAPHLAMLLTHRMYDNASDFDEKIRMGGISQNEPLSATKVLAFIPSKISLTLSNLLVSAFDVVYCTFDAESSALSETKVLAEGLEDDDNGVRLLGLEGSKIECLPFLRFANALKDVLAALGKPFLSMYDSIVPHLAHLEKAFSESSPDLIIKLIENDVNRIMNHKTVFSEIADTIASSKLANLFSSVRKRKMFEEGAAMDSFVHDSHVKTVSLGGSEDMSNDSPSVASLDTRPLSSFQQYGNAVGGALSSTPSSSPTLTPSLSPCPSPFNVPSATCSPHTTASSVSSSLPSSSSSSSTSSAKATTAAGQSQTLAAVRWIARCAKFLSYLFATQIDAVDAQTSAAVSYQLILEKVEGAHFKRVSRSALNLLRNDMTLSEVLCLEHTGYKQPSRFHQLSNLISPLQGSDHESERSHIDLLSSISIEVPQSPQSTGANEHVKEKAKRVENKNDFGHNEHSMKATNQSQSSSSEALFELLEASRLAPRAVTWFILKAQPALQILAMLVERECVERWRLSNM